jgi:hypothetical protein
MRLIRGQRGDKDGPGHDLAPITVFTADLELSGFVAPTGQRITDMLLRGQDLAFLPSGADALPENWLMIGAADVLLVVPPPLASPSPWQESRERQRLLVRLPGHEVTGTAHLPADQAERPDRSRLPAFLPLTDAEVARSGSDEIQRFEVTIVNLERSAELHVLT